MDRTRESRTEPYWLRVMTLPLRVARWTGIAVTAPPGVTEDFSLHLGLS